jgi:hypothetical protein
MQARVAREVGTVEQLTRALGASQTQAAEEEQRQVRDQIQLRQLREELAASREQLARAQAEREAALQKTRALASRQPVLRASSSEWRGPAELMHKLQNLQAQEKWQQDAVSNLMRENAGLSRLLKEAVGQSSDKVGLVLSVPVSFLPAHTRSCLRVHLCVLRVCTVLKTIT